MLTYQVLAHCARAERDEAHTHQLAQQLSEFTEWEGISAQAEAHGLSPLLYLHLRAAGTLLPPTVKRELQGLYLRHRQANRVRTRVLGEVLAAYNAAGIQALVLKGAALSHLIYPEPGLRPMGDLDLLVRKAESRRAQSLLAGLGFSAPLPDDEALPDKSLAQAILLTEGLPIGVEIHHNLCEGFDPLSVTMDDLTAAPLPFSLGSTTAYTLGYEDMLWHLCHHMIIHSIGNPIRLIWVADIVSFAERFMEQIDWERIRHHYPMILNTLSLLHSVTPLSEALLGKALIQNGRQPRGIAADFEARPQISLAHWRRKGYWHVLHRALFPSELWLRMYYVLSTTRWLLWYRWVRHPLEILRLFGPRVLRRTGSHVSKWPLLLVSKIRTVARRTTSAPHSWLLHLLNIAYRLHSRIRRDVPKHLIFTVWIERDTATGSGAEGYPSKFLDEDAFLCTRSAMERYAERVNADFLVVQERKYSLMLRRYINRDAPNYERFRLADFLEHYERVLYLDSDILITPNARDIFLECPARNFFYAFDEGHNQRDLHVRRLCSDFDLLEWPKNERGSLRYFNSGVLLASESHNAALERFDPVIAAKTADYGGFEDQDYLNLLIHSQRISCQSLSSHFNCMNLFLSDFEQRFSADFIHYAGTGFSSHTHGLPYSQLMRLCNMQIVCDYVALYGKRPSLQGQSHPHRLDS